jgi:hypothetical protein
LPAAPAAAPPAPTHTSQVATIQAFIAANRPARPSAAALRPEDIDPDVLQAALDGYALALADLDRPEDHPSWLKAITDVDKAEGIWRGFYESLTGRTSRKLRGTNAADFALSHLVSDTVTGVMQFLPANATNEQSLKVAAIAQSILPDWFVISLNGDADTTNETAESIVKDYVRKAKVENKKGVWVISQGMGSRSFSVPEINVVLLTYDNGSLGATVQKMSRCLTAGSADKIGHIVSFSIDGNRSDVVAAMALESAVKVAEESNEPLEEVLRRARRTIPIFDLDDNGDLVEINSDEYLERAMSLNAARQLVVNRQALIEIDSLSGSTLREMLADLPTQLQRLGDKDIPFLAGTRFVDGRVINRQNREITEEEVLSRLRQEVEKKLKVLTERLDHLVYFLPSRKQISLETALFTAESNPDEADAFLEVFSLTPREVRVLISWGLINVQMLEVVMLRSL